MRIITASAGEAAAAFIPSSKPPVLEDPEQQHLACSLFTITQLNADTLDIALRLRSRQPDAPNFMQSALGCVVDYAARLAAEPYIGYSTLSECELHIGESCAGNTLVVNARIDGIMGNCATYECEVYVKTAQRQVLIAHSLGTLLAETAPDLSGAPAL